MDRGSFLSSSDLAIYNVPSRAIINPTPGKNRCIKRSDIFRSVHTHARTHAIFLSSYTYTVDFTGVSNALIKCSARAHRPLCFLVNYDRRQTNRRPSFYPFITECQPLPRLASRSKTRIDRARLNDPLRTPARQLLTGSGQTETYRALIFNGRVANMPAVSRATAARVNSSRISQKAVNGCPVSSTTFLCE